MHDLLTQDDRDHHLIQAGTVLRGDVEGLHIGHHVCEGCPGNLGHYLKLTVSTHAVTHHEMSGGLVMPLGAHVVVAGFKAPAVILVTWTV